MAPLERDRRRGRSGLIYNIGEMAPLERDRRRGRSGLIYNIGEMAPLERDRRRGRSGLIYNIGEMAEWSNAAVSKTVVPLPRDRGFESPSLRKAKANYPDDTVGVVLFLEGTNKTCFVKFMIKTKHTAKAVLLWLCRTFLKGSPKVIPPSTRGS
jgi:hypothetical protein